MNERAPRFHRAEGLEVKAEVIKLGFEPGEEIELKKFYSDGKGTYREGAEEPYIGTYPSSVFIGQPFVFDEKGGGATSSVVKVIESGDGFALIQTNNSVYRIRRKNKQAS